MWETSQEQMAKLSPRVPILLIPSSTTPSSGTDSSHRECNPNHTPDMVARSHGEGSEERRRSPGAEVRGRKGGNADAETSTRGFSFHYPGASPRRRLPSQKAEAENIHTYLQLQYKRAANLMIRDYYLKGPTVTDLFVISCNNTDGNEFICINVSVTRTSVEILH